MRELLEPARSPRWSRRTRIAPPPRTRNRLGSPCPMLPSSPT